MIRCTFFLALLACVAWGASACKESGLTAPQACRDGCEVTCEKHGSCNLLQLGPDGSVTEAVEACTDECKSHCAVTRWSCPQEKDSTPACQQAIADLACDAYEDYINQTLLPPACESPCVD